MTRVSTQHVFVEGDRKRKEVDAGPSDQVSQPMNGPLVVPASDPRWEGRAEMSWRMYNRH